MPKIPSMPKLPEMPDIYSYLPDLPTIPLPEFMVPVVTRVLEINQNNISPIISIFNFLILGFSLQHILFNLIGFKSYFAFIPS
jgi:hypothetical protein